MLPPSKYKRTCIAGKWRILWMLGWLSYFSAFGNGETPRIINFNKEAYRAQNQIWEIAQSPRGFMYFGNNAGLIEFDGTRWRTYILPDKQIVRAVACDSLGHVFTGGFGQFGYWANDQHTGELTYHSLSNNLRYDRIEKEEIWHIVVFSKGVLFQSFGIIYYYDYHEVKEIVPPSNIMFLQAVNKEIIVPVISKGLFRWQPDKGFEFVKGSEKLAGQKVKTLLPFPQGWLVGTEEEGLYLYDGESFSLWSNPTQTDIKNFQLNKAIRLANGWFALGTILNGIYLLKQDGSLAYHYSKENGLQNNTVLALFQDHAGDIWTGLDKGIDLLALSEPLTYYQDRNGKIGAVYCASIFQGWLYVGTNQGVYTKPWPDNGIDFQLINGTQGQVWELRIVDGQLLCGHNEGTFVISGKTAKKISAVTGGWKMASLPGVNNQLIQGTYTGLALLKKSATGQWDLGQKLNNFSEPVKFLAVDAAGSVLAANPYKGLKYIRMDSEKKSVINILELGKQQGLFNPYKVQVANIDDQVLVFADTSILLWDAGQGALIPISTFRKTPVKGHFRIIPGIGPEWFKVYADHIEWFTDDKALGSLPLRLVADFENIIPLNDNFYLFCLDNGYALLDRLKRNLNPAYVPSPTIRQLATNTGKVFAPFLLPEKSALALAPNTIRFRLEYTSPFYTSGLMFRSRLNNFERDWSVWSENASREFTNLSPGHYLFEVQSNISSVTATITIIIQPKWYQTYWARGIFALGLMAFLALLFSWNHQRFERQRRRLEIEKERQLQQERIKTRNEQLQNDVINKSKELASSTFNLVRKNETLMQIKEALIDIKSDLGTRMPDKYYRQLIHLIDSHLDSEHDWQIFETNFNQVHEVFFKKIKEDFPNLTPGDLRLAAYLKMNLSSKEVAPLLNISLRGVENKRYRLRHKLGLPNDANLTEFLLSY